MSVCQIIIETIDRDRTSSDKLLRTYPWNNISTEDRNCLLKEAERRITDIEKPDELLRLLYRMTRVDSPWDAIRILAFYTQRPDTSSADKNRLLDLIRRELDKRRDSLGATANPQDIHKYKSYEASYFGVKAKILIESKDYQGALQNYREALAICEEYHLQERATRLQSDIAVTEALLTGDFTILPPELLEVEELERLKKLAALREETAQQREQKIALELEISTMQREYEKLQRELAVIRPEIQLQNTELGNIKKAVRQETQTLGEMQTQIHAQETGLQFLEVLPRAATGPLWVEVVRLALHQGEIDDLLRQAIERLSIRFPDDAASLMAEIAARSRNPFSIDISPPQADAVAQWLTAIAKARALKTEDIGVAAQVLVEAWDGLFLAMKGIGVND